MANFVSSKFENIKNVKILRPFLQVLLLNL